MPSPTLASPADLAQFTGLSHISEDRLNGALLAASALVRSYCRSGKPDGWITPAGELEEDIPDAVVQATVFIARRVALMPESGVSDESAGPFSVKRDNSMWMSGTEKALLEPWAQRSSFRSIGVQSVVGDHRPALSDYVPVVGGGDLLYFPDGA